MAANEINASTPIKIGIGAVVSLLFGGLAIASRLAYRMADKVDDLSTSNVMIVSELKHLGSRQDETNSHLEAIDLKTDGQVERLMQVGQRQGEFSVRIQSLEKRMDAAESRLNGQGK